MEGEWGLGWGVKASLIATPEPANRLEATHFYCFEVHRPWYVLIPSLLLAIDLKEVLSNVISNKKKRV